MYGIFMECLVDLKDFGGNGSILVLLLISSIYLIVKESDIKKKLLFGIMPFVIVAGFLFPITKKLYVSEKLLGIEEAATYYRILWLIPMYVTIAYAFTKFISGIKSAVKKRVAVGVVAVVIAVTGSCVYSNEYVFKAENPYHIPQHVIDICDRISPLDGEERVRAAFPPELTYFVRQYNTDILLAYGRDYVDNGYYTGVKAVMSAEGMMKTDELLYYTRMDLDRYIIIPTDKEMDKDITQFNVRLVDTVDKYNIYEDILIGDNRELERDAFVAEKEKIYGIENE
ncbi:MAG: hypothetical protein J5802_03660 [Butyrivibrio sp.]|nr:hypothetical protein [Butyrivibrio sp.]